MACRSIPSLLLLLQRRAAAPGSAAAAAPLPRRMGSVEWEQQLLSLFDLQLSHLNCLVQLKRDEEAVNVRR